MAYSITLLGEKDGFQKQIIFRSAFDLQEIGRRFEQFRKLAVGVVKDHLPYRCPIRTRPEEGQFELFFDERSLVYNFDPLLQFVGEILQEGTVKAAKVMDGGRIGAAAYVVTPGKAEKFEFYPSGDSLAKIQAGTAGFPDLLKNNSGETLAAYAARSG